ncbi:MULTISPECIES: addiction module antidote protein [unclassified Endozoicomonas]|uniref:addiction module antidote protein n=1 Tax=unclassified Endozoicomonas TaxID=2644528 RepID=UPI003BB7DC0A
MSLAREAFIIDAYETGDASYIARAPGVVAWAEGMGNVARQADLSREQLYTSFIEDGNPTLKTILSIMQALGFSITPKSQKACHSGAVSDQKMTQEA